MAEESSWISYTERLESLTEEELTRVMDTLFPILKKEGVFAKVIGRNSQLQKKYFPGMRMTKIQPSMFKRAVQRAIRSNDDFFLGPLIIEKWLSLYGEIEMSISQFLENTEQLAAYEAYRTDTDPEADNLVFAVHYLLYQQQLDEGDLRLFLKLSGGFDEPLFMQQVQRAAEIENAMKTENQGETS
ncbi:MAG: hypothetical protein D6675_03475 [Gemmatimonadetes bacterium]|nr:MAG: hypothetical protein D6675_03475 [Gemmatimonadota bacterium]